MSRRTIFALVLVAVVSFLGASYWMDYCITQMQAEWRWPTSIDVVNVVEWMHPY